MRKVDQTSQKEIQEHLNFMVNVGLLEKKGENYTEPEICNSFSKEQREFVLSVSEKSYLYGIKKQEVVK